jgi:hypothetical protein
MWVINARNVHDALPEAIRHLALAGKQRESRNGPVLVADGPVTTVYSHPRERVLFWPERDANPFFHFYEGLWMLGGRHDVKSLARFVPRMEQFSDDGQFFSGAYGYRWVRHFGFDQLQNIAWKLRSNPDDRRQVLQMFDPHADSLVTDTARDVPCNLSVCFQVNSGALDMIVYNRSNDIIWGCYGANAVHFSMLQEVMAAMVGVPVGRYWQVSFNWHAYLATFTPLRGLADQAAQPPSYGNRTPYEMGLVAPYTMMNSDPATWFADLEMFLSEEGRALGYRDPFFRRVALPMMRTHDAFKTGGQTRFTKARAEAQGIVAADWRLAVQEWLDRRELRAREKVTNGPS